MGWQPIDDLRERIGVRIRDECGDFLGRRRQADQVERRPANQRMAVRRTGRCDVERPQLRLDEAVDRMAHGFTTWLAGGGVKGGQVIGATDEFGLHATVLKLLGLDHRRLTFLFQGRDQRLTDVGGDHEFADRLLR